MLEKIQTVFFLTFSIHSQIGGRTNARARTKSEKQVFSFFASETSKILKDLMRQNSEQIVLLTIPTDGIKVCSAEMRI